MLLQLEEAEADIGMEKWNLKGVSIFKDCEVSDCYSVPALLLTERRPSVLVGDVVKVQHSAGGNNRFDLMVLDFLCYKFFFI